MARAGTATKPSRPNPRATDAPPPSEPERRGVSPWVKAIIAFHVVATTAWALPVPKKDLLEGKVPPFGSDHLLLFNQQKVKSLSLVQGWVFMSGTWQYWDMFSPDPARTDMYGDALVEFEDGSTKVVGYPRIYAMNLVEKYPMERFRKYYERAGSDDNAFLWPIFARVLARQSGYRPDNPPVLVTLRRHWLDIAPPGKPQATEYNQYAYYRYVIGPGDLERKGGIAP